MHRVSATTIVALALAASACDGGKEANLTLAFVGNGQDMDPVVQDFPVVFVRRPLIHDNTNAVTIESARELNAASAGADLILKDRAIPSAKERSLLLALGADESTPPTDYDVRDLEPDYDGSRVVFSLRGPIDPDADDDEQPSWNIWVYDLIANELTRVIASDTVAEAGQDRDPHFLPDGRIIFTSNRQRQSRAILLDEGRPQFGALDEDRREEAFVLHVMDADGSNIEQLTFNQSHDQDPEVLSDGRIVFSRWDNVPGRDVISLYRANPDGTQMERLYGYHSQQSGRDGSDIVFLEPRQLEDGRILVLARGDNSNRLGNDLLIVDADNFVESDQPTYLNQGQSASGQTSPLSGLVQLESISTPGRYLSAWPLYDGTDRMLVTWSQCRLVEATTTIVPCTADRLDNAPVEADPLYGLWILNFTDQTQQPVVAPIEGMMISEAVVLSPRPNPRFIAPAMPDEDTQALIDSNLGLLDIRSVYDIEGQDTALPNLTTVANPVLTSAAQRPARFLRLVKPVSLPDRELVDIPGTAFGRSSGELMREILGYATIHPDGSVMVKVPANVPFAVSILDADGRRISPRHRNWLQVRPGETLHCNGCHEANREVAHGRLDAEPPSINPGGPFSGLDSNFAVDPGETMAEAHARNFGAPDTALDLIFEDIWTDATARPKDPGFSLRYQDLNTPAPVSSACINAWQANCRITIHYEAFIHPIWSVDRRVIDTDGVTLLEDHTCTACHSASDAMGMAQVPAAQLDLGDGPSTDEPDHFKSYRELLFGDVEQEVINGALVDRLVPALDNNGNPVFEVDQDGNQILDADGNPIPVLTTVGVAPVLSTAGANASNDFFDLFDPGGSHAGCLSGAELKLIAEWLDIGAQYYNDPFEVPP